MTNNPTCWLCNKQIKGKPHYQGGDKTLPSHKKCLVVIKASRKYGGGI